MNSYETVMIINNEISKEQRQALVNKVTNCINENGKITEIEELGEKKLAYKVKNHDKGYYCVMQFEGETKKVKELEKFYKNEENVLKSIVIKKEGVEE